MLEVIIAEYRSMSFWPKGEKCHISATYGPFVMPVEPKYTCMVLYDGTKSIYRVFSNLE